VRVTCRIHDGLVLLWCDSLAGAVGSEESDIIVFTRKTGTWPSLSTDQQRKKHLM